MEDEPTCGQGLAEHSALPARIAQLSDALAEILEVHQTALDLTDANARKEHEAYVSLAKAYRNVAARLHAIAKEMASYRDLPMGRHDEAAMAGPTALDVFRRYVNREDDLATLLQTALDRDKKMLDEMRGSAGSAT